MLESTPESGEPSSEEAFYAQYQSQRDDVLREIAEGQVPWATDGQFVYAARRAARRVLLERGVDNVPRLPGWDPQAEVAPWRVRLAALAVCVGLGVTAAVIYAALRPPDAPADAALCAAARQQLQTEDFAYHMKLGVSGCEVRRERGQTRGGVTTTPIEMSACIELGEDSMRWLKERGNPLDMLRVRRFASAPRPGRHCVSAPILLAEWVHRPGQPWVVRVLPGVAP